MSKSLPYRLLACDLDGTLMSEQTIIHAPVRRALAAAQARGIAVTLATGRSFATTLPFARDLDISLPLICHQGGCVQHPLSGELLYQAAMERALLLKVVELAHARDWHLVLYFGDDIYLAELRYPLSFYHAMIGSNLQRVDDLAEIVDASEQAPSKFILAASKEQADHIQAEMDARFGQQMVVVRSHDFFVEGNPLGVNKGNALRRLAAELGVPREQVMAIGDQANDVTMIAWAGLGVAMGSGSQAARDVADWIAPPLAAHGAAAAIEHFLLKGDGKD
ncbi:MAG: HAD family phosphatase [Delftia sp.]|nr:HAD family phosphatase [Delftia sp.]